MPNESNGYHVITLCELYSVSIVAVYTLIVLKTLDIR
jgi:hypothetical protein